MIEAGLQDLVQKSAAVAVLCPVGGFCAEVPKGQALPTWSYVFFGGVPTNALATLTGLRMRRYRVDVYAETPADVITLASAIDGVLDNFSGKLADEDATVVDSCMLSEEPIDHPFDFERRGYRRSLEYEIWFYSE